MSLTSGPDLDRPSEYWRESDVKDLTCVSGREMSENVDSHGDTGAGEREEQEDREDVDRSRAGDEEGFQLRSRIALAARMSSMRKLLK